MLAEISDKVPSIPEMWTVAVSASILFWSAALPGGWAARLSVAAATVVSAAFLWAAVEQAWHEREFSQAIWDEMGATWVGHSLAAPLLPAIAALTSATLVAPRIGR